MQKRFLFLVVALLCLVPLLSVEAEEAAIEVFSVDTTIGEHTVSYPQLRGMADEAIMQQINDDIVLSSDITSHLITLATLGDHSWGLQVSYTAYLQGDVFSTVLSASGKMPNGREGQAYTALTYDLTTGKRVTLSDLFTDVDAAVERMEVEAAETLADELSGYMDHANVLPLPTDSFALDADGITFYYEAEQFSYLNGMAGSCQFWYEELSDLFQTAEDGVLARIGALTQPMTVEEQRAAIEKAVTDGELPHVPAKLGDAMPQLCDALILVRDPDIFPGGRYFVMQSPAMRQILLISDNMRSGWEESVVEGIQLRRGGLYGLMIGQSAKADHLACLGEPSQTIAFTENMAYDYGLPMGEADVYHFGTNELRLHTDENGVLCAIQLSK